VTPLKWDVCFTPRMQTSVSYAADCDVIVCYGGATIHDKHLASKVHCVDDEIIGLQRRERRKTSMIAKGHVAKSIREGSEKALPRLC
jgi:hypothetical protein